jgi:hypothetical protein
MGNLLHSDVISRCFLQVYAKRIVDKKTPESLAEQGFRALNSGATDGARTHDNRNHKARRTA